MKHMNLAAATVALAFAVLAIVCSPQMAGAAADTPTASSAPNASTTQAAAARSTAPAATAATDLGQSASPAGTVAQAGSGAGAATPVAPAKPGAASGTISGQITASPAEYGIKTVPNGSYELSAWAPRLAVATKSVGVPGAALTASLHLHRGG